MSSKPKEVTIRQVENGGFVLLSRRDGYSSSPDILAAFTNMTDLVAGIQGVFEPGEAKSSSGINVDYIRSAIGS